MESTELARRRAREAHLSGTTPAQPGRTDIQASWRRVSAAGVDPHGHADIPPLTESEVHHRRSTTGLEGLLALLESSLEAVVDAGHLLVVSDAEGRVLWRRGRPPVRRMADDLGFVAGSAWTEGNVGTNAIGTALVLGEPVQIQGSEHFVESHARWGCSAAPLRDPWTGQLLGVVDISGPRTATHPVLVSTVALAARLAELELLERHRQALDELRTASAHLLGGIDGPAAVIDPSGHVAASSGLVGHQIVSLPDNPQPGRLHLPGLGDVLLDPLPGGWLLRRDHEEAPATRAVLDLTAEPMIEVYAGSARWTRRLTPRHAELLVALVRVGQVGLRATELADAVFADPGRVVTIRAEMCRLRKTLGSLILARPYRLAPSVQVQTQWPLAPAVLLPGSSAPVVYATRRWLAQESGSARPRQT
ncbi:GAF domain-containing protein [Ornithinimicrobium ciconiae]|uniref:GAF domain-containing protein n=1 Tax=Ornithinimicrobium ciconiae TaxID=2594265 RepID=A0A516GE07_9MICO|nr:helix-turn-helix domain-containing protein [Ornithinimicrobium ciconiae]QDO89728.1 GAF domain-containing protein [Ornithinimicrobium ciconiae]